MTKFNRGFCALIMAGLTSLALYSSSGFADMASDVALFHRCYAHITGVRPMPGQPQLAAVMATGAGHLNPIDACMAVLAKANLRSDGKLPNTSDPEQINILSTFNQLHRQFFDIQDLRSAPAEFYSPERFNDPTEGALFLTRLLFEPSSLFKEAVTGNYSVRGIRSLGPMVYYSINMGSSRIWVNASAGASAPERGILQGIRAYSGAENTTWVSDKLLQSITDLNFRLGYTETGKSPRSFGGGIMGLQSYIHMNSGLPKTGYKADGALVMPRRWAKSVLQDMLCRDLPTLRLGDAIPLVNLYNSAPTPAPSASPRASIAFRSSTNCMTCHGAMDPLSATIRGIVYSHVTSYDWSDGHLLADGRISVLTTRALINSSHHKVPASAPPEPPYYEQTFSDSHYWKRPGKGNLRYRRYNGTLVDLPISASSGAGTNETGLDSLGAAMAAGDDLYVCMAARYLDYFAGVKVNLADEGVTALSADDLHYRNIAVQLGVNLKSTQRLDKLIKDIMLLDLYKKGIP